MKDKIKQTWDKNNAKVIFEIPNEIALSLTAAFDNLQSKEDITYRFSDSMQEFHNALCESKVFTQSVKK